MVSGFRNRESVSKRKLLALCLLSCFLAAVSPLNAGSGNLGQALTGAGGGSVTLIQSSTFSITTTPGQPMTGDPNISVIGKFVSAINADANFQAAVITDPNSPSSASFSFLRAGGAEISHMNLCETDPNIDNIGLTIPGGADPLILTKVTALSANGNYRLTIDVWDTLDFDQTFITSSPANDTPAELNSNIQTALMASGYTVTDNGSTFTIHRPGDMIVSARISSTDTGVVNMCLDLTAMPMHVGAIPTVSEYGLLILSLLLMTGAVVMVRRKRSAGGPQGS